MKLLTDLFFTDYGLMTFLGFVFMLGMGGFFLRMFLVKMNEKPTPNPAAVTIQANSTKRSTTRR